LYDIAEEGHRAYRGDRRINPSYYSNEKICSGKIEQVGINESRDRRSCIDLFLAGRQLTGFPSFGKVCVWVERRGSEQRDVHCKDVRHIVVPDISHAVEHADDEDLRSDDAPRFPKGEDNTYLVSTFGARDRPYFHCLGLGEKRAKEAMIKFANSSREGSILIEHATKELPLTGTPLQSVRCPSYFYVMWRLGIQMRVKSPRGKLAGGWVREESPYEISLSRVGKLDVGRITSWLPNEGVR
jgi:hypothetical protein